MFDSIQTHRSLILRAAEGDRDALGELYSTYWTPLFAYAQYGFRFRLNAELAEERVQEFTCRAFVEGQVLRGWDPEKGKFRPYLKICFQNFVYEKDRRSTGLAHGGGIDDDPDAPDHHQPKSDPFETHWALQALVRAVERWKQECRNRGDPRRWQVFEMRVLRPIWEDRPAPPYEEIRRKLGYAAAKEVMNVMTNASRAIHKHLRLLLHDHQMDGADLEQAISQRAAELRRARPGTANEDCWAEAARQIQQRVEEAVDGELADIVRILCAGKAVSPHVGRQRPWTPERPSETAAAGAPPAGENPESVAIYRSALRMFVDARLDDAALAEAEFASGTLSLKSLISPDIGQLEITALLAPLLEPDPLGAELQQQLLGPLPWAVAGSSESRVGGETTAGGPPIRTLGDLLAHPQPPLELVKRLHEYGRTNREREDTVPKEVGTALYFGAIALALVRCGQRITSLRDDKIFEGIKWVLTQSWVDGSLRPPLKQAAKMLRPLPPPAER